MKPKLIERVETTLFEDENGICGLTHSNTFYNPSGNRAFDAFWDGGGLFHDVFEHSHEGSLHFRDNAFMNLGGEMAAMGAMWYYLENLPFGNRFRGTLYRSHSEIVINNTIMDVQEAIETGDSQFGNTLECNVPPQAVIEDYIEEVITEYNQKMAAYSFREDRFRGEDDKNRSEEFRKSCTPEKIANLHRWGYRNAERLVPATYHNGYVLHQFIEFWNKFCERFPAEELMNEYKGIVFNLFHGRDETLLWRADLMRLAGGRKFIRSNELYLFDMDKVLFA